MFFLFILFVVGVVDLNDSCGLSLSIHNFGFNLWITVYEYCILVSESYAKTLCDFVIEINLN